jgi:hypothetical protein
MPRILPRTGKLAEHTEERGKKTKGKGTCCFAEPDAAVKGGKKRDRAVLKGGEEGTAVGSCQALLHLKLGLTRPHSS